DVNNAGGSVLDDHNPPKWVTFACRFTIPVSGELRCFPFSINAPYWGALFLHVHRDAGHPDLDAAECAGQGRFSARAASYLILVLMA
ncbi:hypothetical protein, partial [Lacimonas salitolerans]